MATRKSAAYKALKAYIRFMVEKVYYRKSHYLDVGNLPEDGTPILIVSNHQNCLNDALGLLLGIKDRFVRFIARADIFAVHPLLGKFLRSLGLLPAFRINYEGEQALANNGSTFQQSEETLNNGGSVVIYPEAGHQDKHWLGTFSYGYTRMAFEAAKASGFQKDIVIMPTCNHYSGYFGLRNSILIRFGTPVSLKPFYELFQTKPRTAQREVHKLVREQISSMMLNIEDLDNYPVIDYIRTSAFGDEFCSGCGADPGFLPGKLEADKKLVSILANGDTASIYDDTRTLLEGMAKAGLSEKSMVRNHSTAATILHACALVILAPLALFCIWPSMPVYYIAKYFTDRVGDKMLSGSFLIGISVLITLPLAAIITLIAVWCCKSFLVALVYILLFPAICLFEWHYSRLLLAFRERLRGMKAASNGTLDSLKDLRKDIFRRLREICKH